MIQRKTRKITDINNLNFDISKFPTEDEICSSRLQPEIINMLPDKLKQDIEEFYGKTREKESTMVYTKKENRE